MRVVKIGRSQRHIDTPIFCTMKAEIDKIFSYDVPAAHLVMYSVGNRSHKIILCDERAHNRE